MGEARGTSRALPYTATAVTRFLGWDEDKVKNALGALELIEKPRAGTRARTCSAMSPSFEMGDGSPLAGNRRSAADDRPAPDRFGEWMLAPSFRCAAGH